MARKPSPRYTSRRKEPVKRPRLTSGVIGGILLALATIWLGWLLLHQFGSTVLSTFPLAGFVPQPQPGMQIASLAAEGITLSQADQTPALTQQQALLIANQLEPDAAAQSRQTSAQYVQVSYTNRSTPATHADLNNVPVWLIHYQKIPVASAAAAVDPKLSSYTSYDLYVFLDANNGKELLVVQV